MLEAGTRTSDRKICAVDWLLSPIVGMLLAVEQKMGQPLARVVAGAAGADQEVRVFAIADPGFFAVDDEMVALAARARPDLQYVGADIGFGNPHRDETVSAQEAGQVAFTQMRRRDLLEQHHAERVDQHRHRQVGRGGCYFLEQHQRSQPIQAHAAVGFARDARHQPELRQLAHDAGHLVARHELVAVLLAEDRIDLGVKEAFQSIDGSLLLFGAEYVSHATSLLFCQHVDADHGFFDAIQTAAVFLDCDACALDLALSGFAAQLRH
jgi:hypothetical protein